MAFNPSGTLAYVAMTSSNQIAVIDTATGTLGTPITACSGIGNGPISVAIKSATKGLVACTSDRTVVEFNPTTGATTKTISVGIAPFFVALSPSGGTAYVANSGSSTVSVINTTTDLVTNTITVGSGPVAVAFNPAGTVAYVANSTVGGTGNSVSVINVATSTQTTSIALPGVPYGLAVSPNGASLYVSRNNGLKVSIIATATNVVGLTFTTIGKPQGVTFSPDGRRVYVPMLTGGTAVFDTATQTQLTALPSGSQSRIMAFNPAGTLAYVTNNADSNVSVFTFDNDLPTISGTPPTGSEGSAYTFTPTVTGSNPTMTLNSGSLPPGVTLGAGVVSGTPTLAGTYSFTLRETNDNGHADLATSITVAPGFFDVTFQSAGGSPTPATQSVRYNLKALAPSDPTLAGNSFNGWWNGATRWNFATNSVTAAVTLTAHWLVRPTIAAPSTATAPLDALFSWSPTITALPGYVVTSSALPAGLVLSSTTGHITGTPTGSVGATLVTVTVTDANGATTFDVAITVTHGVAVSLTSTPSDAAPNMGDTITVTVIAHDAHGNAWDVSDQSTITSSVASDTITGNSVTFNHASPHVLTAAFGGLTSRSLVQVLAALAITGGGLALWLVAAGIGALVAGAALVVAMRRRRRAALA